ncbi:UBIQUITIN-CONJUGAT-2 domain-containing protein [Mycena kentingensis (nom. inval.)]|nr:UBIQUITIN-CONJUGAT-2 domain-containing protein [Mycena kentingensis (nom. inval.)]
MPRKRAHSPSSPSKPRKRTKTEQVIVISDGEEDDLEAILAQIKESEERERVQGSSGEDDAALARRLAAEWAAEDAPDVQVVDAPHASSSKEENSPDDAPPDAILQQFRNLFTAERNCSKCGKTVKSPRGFVVFSPTSTPGAIPPSLGMLLHALCDSCGTNHCRGCFKPTPCSKSCKGTAKNASCPMPTCCSALRAIAVFECLGGFDRLYLGERNSADERATELAKQHQHRDSAATVGPGGTGYGTGSGTYGYNNYKGRGSGKGKGKNATRKAQLADHWDELLVRALQTLTRLLPSPYAEDAQEYDLLPHASIGHLISLSQIPELLGTLLRNDSVTDWGTRSEVYYATIALLRRMADCELTVEVLIARRFCFARTAGLEEWMWADGQVGLVWERDKQGRLERAMPLYEYFKKLAKQCEAFLAGAHAMMENGDEDNDAETVQAVSLCGDMIAAGDDMERAMAVLGRVADSSSSSGKGKGRDPAIDLENEYIKACEALAFEHVEMDLTQYNYNPNLEQTQSATRTPKDRLHLLKELATMATSLPAGIFVRVDEVRNDAIKVLIAGPEDTPYAGGLFEFDVFIPLQYPNVPPLVHLRTTGGGSVRFNPNLYNEGKVCLSLLGTWPGRPEEQWNPSTSTLLQVLVSIQSMILIETPYFNEPGHGKSNPKSPASVQYNTEIQRQTCRWAIVDWFSEGNRDCLWKDVIVQHFSLRTDRIREQMLKWANKNAGIRAYCGIHSREVLDLVKLFDDGMARWGK